MNQAIILKPTREQSVKRFHPWIFSGGIAKIIGSPKDGDVVEVLDSKQNFLAIGHYFGGSISVKILSFEQTEIDEHFWFSKIENAFQLRKRLISEDTNCYRLIHGEADGLPGLIADVYNGVVVLQAHSVGMFNALEMISTAIQRIFGTELKAIYNKSKETLPSEFAKEIQNSYLFGECAVPHLVKENAFSFLIDWETGQKTGFFLDQRQNRKLLQDYSKDKKVLNAFCYSGGFSVYALGAGAKEVWSVDVSKKAIELTDKNIEENFNQITHHQSHSQDVMAFMKQNDDEFDVIILDPPAFAKNISAKHNAIQGYKRLNMEGIKRLKSKGILFTFSCSQVIDQTLFYNTIVSAAIESGRKVRVLHQLTQAPDHPINLFHPEGNYLKGLVLEVE